MGNFGSRREINTTDSHAGLLRTKRDIDSQHQLVVVDQVEVVDDEHGRRLYPGIEIGEQLVHGVDACPRTSQQRQSTIAASRHQRVQGGNRTGPELDELTVGLVQGQPGARRRRLCRPAGDERRLSGARGRDDEGERAAGHLLEEVEQARAADVVPRGRRTTQLLSMQRHQCWTAAGGT